MMCNLGYLVNDALLRTNLQPKTGANSLRIFTQKQWLSETRDFTGLCVK